MMMMIRQIKECYHKHKIITIIMKEETEVNKQHGETYSDASSIILSQITDKGALMRYLILVNAVLDLNHVLLSVSHTFS